MRTIRFYEANGKPWISPTRYLSAILSGESITGVDHAGIKDYDQAIAIVVAWQTILKYLQSSLWKAFGGFLYTITFVLTLVYPPLVSRIPPVIHSVTFLLLLCTIMLPASSIIKISIIRIRLKWLRNKVTNFTVRRGPDLEPPLIAHMEPTIPRPSISIACMLLTVSLLLNCVMLATPLRPAVCGGIIYERPTLVLPGTAWRAVPRYPTDVAFSYFYYDGVGLWGVQVSYSVEQVDLLAPTPEFRSWMQSYLYTISNSVNNSIATSFTPEMSEDQRLDAYLKFWEDPEMADQLIAVLTSGFNSVYDKVLVMRGIDVTVRYVSISEYQKITGD